MHYFIFFCFLKLCPLGLWASSKRTRDPYTIYQVQRKKIHNSDILILFLSFFKSKPVVSEFRRCTSLKKLKGNNWKEIKLWVEIEVWYWKENKSCVECYLACFAPGLCTREERAAMWVGSSWWERGGFVREYPGFLSQSDEICFS